MKYICVMGWYLVLVGIVFGILVSGVVYVQFDLQLFGVLLFGGGQQQVVFVQGGVV